MICLFTPLAACSVLMAAPAGAGPDVAQASAGPVEGTQSEPATPSLPATAGLEPAEAKPVELLAWDGDYELLKASRRLRVWRSHLAYEMSVDAEGQAVDCTIYNEFRSAYVNQRLCDVLTEHHDFAPARNAEGEPVAGSYVARISYMDLRERMD